MILVEAICFSDKCGTYDWGTEDDRPRDICPTCFAGRIIIEDGRHVSGNLQRAGGNRTRGKDTKVRGAYARDAI